jgi:hypothetical protein
MYSQVINVIKGRDRNSSKVSISTSVMITSFTFEFFSVLTMKSQSCYELLNCGNAGPSKGGFVGGNLISYLFSYITSN